MIRDAPVINGADVAASTNVSDPGTAIIQAERAVSTDL
jgi:hypothetical protein